MSSNDSTIASNFNINVELVSVPPRWGGYGYHATIKGPNGATICTPFDTGKGWVEPKGLRRGVKYYNQVKFKYGHLSNADMVKHVRNAAPDMTFRLVPKLPTVDDVLSSLVMDAGMPDSYNSLHEFANDMGYDLNDEEKYVEAQQAWAAVRKVGRELAAFCHKANIDMDALAEAYQDY